MKQVLYCLVLLNAVVSFAAAVAVWRKNRYQVIGPLFGLTLSTMGAWFVGFAHYYLPLSKEAGFVGAYLTMSFSILAHAFWFHTLCAMANQRQRLGWLLAGCYGTGAVMLFLLWTGRLIPELRAVPYMDHYARYDRHLYPWLMLYLIGWQFLGVGLAINAARRQVGYRRTQLVYFLVAWLIIFLTTTSIIIPLEYNINIPPFGFLILPLNLALVAYVMAKARLADVNVVIARVMMHALTLLTVAALSLLFIGAVTLLSPGFMNAQQVVFTTSLVTTIGLTLAVVLPRWLPQAERLVEQRMLGGRSQYQETLAGLVRELSHLGTLDEILTIAVNRVYAEMQLTRALMLMPDSLSGDFVLKVESGATETDGLVSLAGKSAIISWIEKHSATLVRDELPRGTDERTLRTLDAELSNLKVVVCIPLMLEKRLLGVLCLGEKLNREMYYASDLRVLETLAAEVSLAIRYRRLEEQVMHQNKLVELGTIAAGIAHEIRNPLASIRTFAQLLPDKMNDPEFQTDFRLMVLHDVERITKVIQSMLAFSRPGTINMAPHPVEDVVEEAILLVQAHLKSKQLELSQQFHEKPLLRVDKQQILQVLVNLLNNAADVLSPGGRIRISTGVRQMEALDGGEPQTFAVIEVTDNGQGIPPAVRNRLFDPFFTTKKDGTGLGLSISQKIVRDHGGIITVSSIEGKGTSFQVNMPIEPFSDKNVKAESMAVTK